MTEINETQLTIAKQIGARELKFAKFMLITMDANTIRVHKGKKNLDIKYDEGSDTYTVSKHKINRDLTCTTEVIKDRCWEDLRGMIEEFFKFEYVMDRFIIPEVTK